MAMQELIEIEEVNVMSVFTNQGGLDPYVQMVRDEVARHEYELSTAKGRAEIASLANKVAKTKVYMDGLGKDLVSQWKSKSKAVDASRKSMRDQLDLLKIEVRKPLTDWEDSEKLRLEEEKAKIEAELLAKQVESDHEIGILMNNEFDRVAAEKIQEQILIELKAEQERKELEAEKERQDELKAEQEGVVRKEKERQIAKEAAAKAEKEKNEAEARAKQAEQDKIRAQERAKIIEEQAKERAEMAAKKAVEREQLLRKKAEEEKRIEQQKLEANRAHVGKIRRAAKESLMVECKLTESQAKSVVLVISKGAIANVSINY